MRLKRTEAKQSTAPAECRGGGPGSSTLLQVCTGTSNPQSLIGNKVCQSRQGVSEGAAPHLSTGLAFLPASVSYLIGTNIFGVLASRTGRYVAWGSGKSRGMEDG